MASTIAILVIGNLVAYAIYKTREVPPWWEARWEQKLLRLLWPTAILVYLLAPRSLEAPHSSERASGMTAAEVRALIDARDE